MALRQPKPMRIADYLDREFQAETRSEFVDGELISMAGVREPHVLIVMSLGRHIGNKLDGKPCRVYATDLRVRIKSRPRYRYPDLFIICGKTEFDPSDPRQMSVTNPRVVIEVLSESTELEDRGRKFDDYRSIDGFEEYLLVHQSTAKVESYRRQKDGAWKIKTWEGLRSTARIESLRIALPMKKVYEHVELDASTSRAPATSRKATPRRRAPSGRRSTHRAR